MDSLPLFHSWPLYDATVQMGLGLGLPGSLSPDASASNALGALASENVGIWSCDLATETLSWSPAVYELFGLPQDEALTRSFIVSRYVGHSRAAMETLRAHAIDHRRGFTLDAVILRANGDRRWMRLCGMPIIIGNKVARLTGTKQDVTEEYDGPDWYEF